MFYLSSDHRYLHSFPTRRSSDLPRWSVEREQSSGCPSSGRRSADRRRPGFGRDRKSTRLNSSHVAISYAVFCLKKKIVIVLVSLVLLTFRLVCYILLGGFTSVRH